MDFYGLLIVLFYRIIKKSFIYDWKGLFKMLFQLGRNIFIYKI